MKFGFEAGFGRCCKALVAAAALALTVGATGVMGCCANQPSNNPARSFADAQIGDVVTYGTFEQDENPGADPIQWQVIARDGSKVLIMTDRAILSGPINKAQREDATWETCTLRGYLNGEFIDIAFTEDEAGSICESILSTADNELTGKTGGNDTVDKVFVLSIEEVLEYMPVQESRVTGLTYQARNDHTTRFSASPLNKTECSWWLRNRGNNVFAFTRVTRAGGINYPGYLPDDITCGIRPAMWVETA